MVLLKGSLRLINFQYRAARMQGYGVCSMYRAALPWIVKRPIAQSRKVPVEVYYFSCDRDLPEQVASIRSFIRYVGIPDQFTVVSDGTYSPDSCQLLRQISPCVDVVHMDSLVRKDLIECLRNYANIHPLGKKLSVLMSIPINQTTIYADSDILFFPGADELIGLAQMSDRQPCYLPDCATALDERLLDNELEKANPVNSGFMLLNKALDWEMSLNRLAQLQEIPNYFTEQTMVHLTMHYNKALPLDPNRFIVRRDDEFIYTDKYAGKKIALRHYINPVRHKFWLSTKI